MPGDGKKKKTLENQLAAAAAMGPALLSHQNSEPEPAWLQEAEDLMKKPAAGKYVDKELDAALKALYADEDADAAMVDAPGAADPAAGEGCRHGCPLAVREGSSPPPLLLCPLMPPPPWERRPPAHKSRRSVKTVAFQSCISVNNHAAHHCGRLQRRTPSWRRVLSGRTSDGRDDTAHTANACTPNQTSQTCKHI
jgi:hypothetical protein